MTLGSTEGYRDMAQELGDPIPDGYEEGDFGNVPEVFLDMTDYLRGKIDALTRHIKESDKASRSAANTASCLANGIKPD